MYLVRYPSQAVRLYDRLLRQRLLAVLSAPGTILDQAEVPSEGAVWAGGLLEDNLPEASHEKVEQSMIARYTCSRLDRDGAGLKGLCVRV